MAKGLHSKIHKETPWDGALRMVTDTVRLTRTLRRKTELIFQSLRGAGSLQPTAGKFISEDKKVTIMSCDLKRDEEYDAFTFWRHDPTEVLAASLMSSVRCSPEELVRCLNMLPLSGKHERWMNIPLRWESGARFFEEEKKKKTF